MVSAALLLIWSTVAASLTTYLWDDRATLGARLCAGAAIGMALLGFTGYAFSAIAGQMTITTLFLAALSAGLPFLLLLRRRVRAALVHDFVAVIPTRIPSRRRSAFGLAALLLSLLLFRLFQGTMYSQDGGIFTNNNNNLGDLPFHFSVIQGFLHGANFPPQDTEYAGARLTYPFLIDFVTAQLMEVGASAAAAFLLQSFLLMLASIGLFYRAALLMTRSVFATIVAPLLFLFSGGLGFLHFFQDPHVGRTWLDLLRHVPREYTMNGDEGLRWGNALTTLLTTQRGLPLAIPFALSVCTIWWQERGNRGDGASMRRSVAAGALTGMLPLIHGHTFLMLLLVGGIFAFSDLVNALRPGRAQFKACIVKWALFFGIAVVLAIPQTLLLSQGSAVDKAGFFAYEPGWVADPGNLAGFWWLNLGLFIPLLVVALLARRHGRPLIGRRLRYFYLPFLVCFLLPNIVRLAPWDMDNMKIFLYWHLASSIVVASLLAWLWRRNLALKAVSLVLVASLTLSGALDVLRVVEGVQSQQIFDQNGIAFANAVQVATPPNSVILHYPLHNHPLLLAGRHLVMGYEGHLWSHGIDSHVRKHDVQEIYAGAPDARALIAKYHIDYVVVGYPEQIDPNSTQIQTRPSLWAGYPVVVSTGGYTLYDVRKPL